MNKPTNQLNNDINLCEYFAISIDTCIFRKLGYNFEHSLIKNLSELSAIVDILIHEIVFREITSHLTEEIRTVDNNVKKAISELKRKKKDITEEQIRTINAMLQIGKENEIVNKKLLNFSKNTNCKILEGYENFDLKRLIDDYFDNVFPFENKSDKKNEFPDAIILHSLENYSKYKKEQKFDNYKILVISEDKGWEKFAENSEFLDHTNNLSTVYNAIFSFETSRKILQLIKYAFYLQPNKLYDNLYDALLEKVDNLLVDILTPFVSRDGIEVVRVDEEYQIDLQDVYLPQKLSINTINLEEDRVIFVLPLILNIYVSAGFGFYLFDYHNNDYKEFYIKEESREKLFNFDITIELTFNKASEFKNLDINDVTISRIELPTDKITFDFTDVGYDYYDPNY